MRRIVVVGPPAEALEAGLVTRREPERALGNVENPHRSLDDALGYRVELGAGRELARELEQRLRPVCLAPLGFVEACVREGNRGVPGEHLEKAEVVAVELVDPELRQHEHADDVRAVPERARR